MRAGADGEKVGLVGGIDSERDFVRQGLRPDRSLREGEQTGRDKGEFFL